ncbi:MAG: hypothetical protein VX622_16010, partial [Pseudomonadota bacterium]|nr:hypothetical protein [Pseudomonadota bacterium]
LTKAVTITKQMPVMTIQRLPAIGLLIFISGLVMVSYKVSSHEAAQAAFIPTKATPQLQT